VGQVDDVLGGREIVEGIGRCVHCDARLVMTREARVGIWHRDWHLAGRCCCCVLKALGTVLYTGVRMKEGGTERRLVGHTD